MLINAASIAIWNRNKVVIAMAMTIWGTSIGFHLYSECRLLIPYAEDLESHTNAVW